MAQKIIRIANRIWLAPDLVYYKPTGWTTGNLTRVSTENIPPLTGIGTFNAGTASNAPGWHQVFALETASITTAHEGGETVICPADDPESGANAGAYFPQRNIGGYPRQTWQVGIAGTNDPFVKKLLTGCESDDLSDNTGAIAGGTWTPNQQARWDGWAYIEQVDDEGVKFLAHKFRCTFRVGGAMQAGNAVARMSLEIELQEHASNTVDDET